MIRLFCDKCKKELQVVDDFKSKFSIYIYNPITQRKDEIIRQLCKECTKEVKRWL